MTDSAKESFAASAPSPQLPTAARSLAAWLRFALPALLGLAADLALKSYAFPDGVAGPTNTVGRHPALLITPDGQFANPPLDIIPHALGFTTTVNHGAVFGIGQGMVSYFLAFSILALALIIWVFISSRKNQYLVHIALGLITAGALGNLYDRALFSGVRDMLRFYVDWYPYIFNIADVALCIGVPLLMLCWLFGKEAKPSTSQPQS